MRTGLVLVSDDLFLIGNEYVQLRRLVQDDTLTAEPAIDGRINGPVDEVLFPVADLLQVIPPFLYVDMTGAARAYLPTVVIEVDVVIFGHFQYRGAFVIRFNRFGGQVRILERKMNSCHKIS